MGGDSVSKREGTCVDTRPGIETGAANEADRGFEPHLALATTLVDVAGSVVEYAEHRREAIGLAVGAADVRSRRADVVGAEADPTSRLGDHGALLQSIIDALDAVFLHLEQEARGELRVWGAGVEQGRRGVGKPFLGHL